MIQDILSLATIADNNPILLDEALEAAASRCPIGYEDESHITIRVNSWNSCVWFEVVLGCK